MALGWDKETYGKAGNAMARGLYDQFILQSEVYSLRRGGVMNKESLMLTQGKLSGIFDYENYCYSGLRFRLL